MSRLGPQINSILKDLKAGKIEKRKDLLDVSYNYLKPVAMKYAKNKADYEDILHDAFLRVFTYIGSANLEKDGYNWLCKIVQNVAYDYNYNNKNQKTVEYESVEYISISFIGDVEERLVAKDALLSEIAKFSEADQQLLFSCYWGDKTVREIGKEMGMGKSTVSKRIIELGKILKKNLE